MRPPSVNEPWQGPAGAPRRSHSTGISRRAARVYGRNVTTPVCEIVATNGRACVAASPSTVGNALAMTWPIISPRIPPALKMNMPTRQPGLQPPRRRVSASFCPCRSRTSHDRRPQRAIRVWCVLPEVVIVHLYDHSRRRGRAEGAGDLVAAEAAIDEEGYRHAPTRLSSSGGARSELPPPPSRSIRQSPTPAPRSSRRR